MQQGQCYQISVYHGKKKKKKKNRALHDPTPPIKPPGALLNIQQYLHKQPVNRFDGAKLLWLKLSRRIFSFIAFQFSRQLGLGACPHRCRRETEP